MQLAAIYATTLATFLIIDAIWLTNVIRPLFERHVGDLLRDTMQFSAAVGFYALYIAGILYFATLPALKSGSGLGVVILNAGILGFLCYGTYEATNMTTLRGWTWSMVIFDTGWGVFLTVLAAIAGFLVGKAMA